MAGDDHQVKILLVEDEVMIAEDTSAALKDMGYEQVTYANSYEEALTMVTEFEPDLLLLDIDLSDDKDRDGIHLAARIQQDRNLPVIFLTQHPISTYRSRLKGVNKVGYLTKTFDLDNLHAAIEVALDTKTLSSTASTSSSTAESPISFSGERFFLRKENRYHCFHFSELQYIRAQDSYCDIYFTLGHMEETVRLSMNLKEVCSQINHAKLFRVHRSYAINLDKLTAFEGNMLFIQGDEIPVGPKYREELLSQLNILGRGK